MARLDHARVKEITQLARRSARVLISTIGSGLAVRGLALQDALGRLMAAELIHGRGTPPEATYTFQACSGSGYGIRIVAA